MSDDRPVRAEDAFDVAAIDSWLRGLGVDGLGASAAPPQVRQFAGGASNLTYLLGTNPALMRALGERFADLLAELHGSPPTRRGCRRSAAGPATSRGRSPAGRSAIAARRPGTCRRSSA